MSAQKKPPSRSLDTFGTSHIKSVKLPTQIRAALADMLKLGAEWYESEQEVQKRVSCAPKDLAKVRDQFAAHLVYVPVKGGKGKRAVWFASTKVAAIARKKQKADEQFADNPES